MIINIKNDFSKEKDEVIQLEESISIMAFMRKKYPKGIASKVKYSLNGEEITVIDFDYVLKDDDIFEINLRPGLLGLIIAAIVALAVVAYLYNLLMDALTPDEVDSEKSTDQNLEFMGKSLNGPIGFGYGTIRMTPRLISDAFVMNDTVGGYYTIETEQHAYYHIDTIVPHPTKNIIHNQGVSNSVDYLGETFIADNSNIEKPITKTSYYLACVGLGKYKVNNVYLGNTNIKELKDESGTIVSYQSFTGDKLKYLNLRNSNTFHKDFLIGYKQNQEIKNLTLTEPYQKLENYNISDINEGEIDEVLINISFSRLYHQGKKHTSKTESNIKFILIETDKYGIKTGRTYEENVKIIGEYTYQTKYSVKIQIPRGYYNMTIIRNQKDSESSKTFYNPTIDSVYCRYLQEGKYDDPNLKNMTFVLFKVRSGTSLNSTGERKIHLDITRYKNDGINKIATINDFVNDIWTNDMYGVKEELGKLDMRVSNTNEFNHYFYEKQKVLGLIQKAMLHKNMDFYPSRGNFVLRHDTKKQYNQLLFSDFNTSSISITNNIKNLGEQDGIVVRYIKKGEVKESSAYYNGKNSIPSNPNEIKGIGIQTHQEALALAKKQYITQFKARYSASVITELDGLIPELKSKVLVSTEINENTMYNNVYSVDTEIKLSNRLNFRKGVKYYLSVINIQKDIAYKGEFSFPEDKNTDIIPLMDVDVNDYVIISSKKTFTKEFIVNSVGYDRKTNEVELGLLEYLEEIYDV